MTEELTLADILNAYACGYFPMAESRDSSDIYWYDPEKRGQLSLPGLHIPARLRRRVQQYPYEIRIDTAFVAVIDGCAAPAPGRPQTWINPVIRDLFLRLHRAGHAHSVEAWQDGKLAGGLYGLALGRAFFGESMFSRADDASKIALVHLCARLWAGGFELLDTQFINDHLKQFGVYEVSRDEYKTQLQKALRSQGDFILTGRGEKELVEAYLQERNR